MKSQFISDLRQGSPVDTSFIVLEKELRTSMKDPMRQFLQLKLGDRTGSMRAKVFEKVLEAGKLFEIGNYIHVKSTVQQYPPLPGKGNLELVLEPANVRKLEAQDVEASDYIPTTKKDIEKMAAELEITAAGFRNADLRLLLEAFFSDEKFMADFKRAPAAKIHHHTYVGGLLEHTHSVLTICKCIAAIHPELDSELLLTGAILHDIGKTRDYEFKASIEITDFGGLVGHLIAGDELLRDKIKSLSNFPDELALRMRHMLLSHHNKGEWGSPIEPRFSEAIALHYADLADSHIAQAVSVEEEEQRKDRSGSWSSFVRELDRMFYLGKKK